jgi:hypothetical protein
VVLRRDDDIVESRGDDVDMTSSDSSDFHHNHHDVGGETPSHMTMSPDGETA